MAHTPGPWWNESGVIHAKAPSWTEDNHSCIHIAILRSPGRLDDAHLIAAAPEMLESIEEFLKGYEEVCRKEHHLGSAIEGALWDVIEPLYEVYRKGKYGEDS